MPTRIQIKARDILQAYLRGEIRPRKRPHYRDHSHYYVFNIGPRWRLVCLKPSRAKNPDAWQLLPHERYSSILAKR